MELQVDKGRYSSSSQWVHVPYGQASPVPSFAHVDNRQLNHDLLLGFRGLIDFGRRNPYNPDSSCQGVRPTPKSTVCVPWISVRGQLPLRMLPRSRLAASCITPTSWRSCGNGVPASPPSRGSPFEPRVSSSGAPSRPGRTTLSPFPVPVIPTPRYATSLPDKGLSLLAACSRTPWALRALCWASETCLAPLSMAIDLLVDPLRSCAAVSCREAAPSVCRGANFPDPNSPSLPLLLFPPKTVGDFSRRGPGPVSTESHSTSFAWCGRWVPGWVHNLHPAVGHPLTLDRLHLASQKYPPYMNCGHGPASMIPHSF
ncbi:hypothetical protein QBC34DRAFT_174502 [Podospora aff. communis PSN243]|uniref:Uncharacterized protein n=1 Tax=Podospora aff. communis PSN243 TaxID=3040156 RepID=A0AAV9GZQ7_9PEZI|nr:hypothetical protein QBC34DRAFT_174502 [Podospora aff. communis PSN243]